MSDLVSLCVLRLEVTDNTNAETSTEAASSTEADTLNKGQRNPRDISVETFPSRLETPREDWGLLPVDRSERTPQRSLSEDDKNEIGFFSGNPFVELTKGILHLYKEDILSNREEALTLCLLGVPATMTCHDLLSFTAPCHSDMAHIRVIRDSTPNQYMALLTFRQHSSAKEFYDSFNGIPFNSLEPDCICRAVWVSRVEWADDGQPPPGHTELPTCPVCLERMDESVDGVLTILCNHAFHADCLLKWGDATCPVCRCVQSPELAESSECLRCGATSPESLWICLICGHVGCGRYQGGHAAIHYRQSGHCYALQLGSHRVWDYKGDNFVHRLLQNKGDGKLVPSAGGQDEAQGAEEKVDSVQLEFTYLLTSQLDAQRQYFEEKLARVENNATAESESLRERLAQLAKTNQQLEATVATNQKEHQVAEKKIAHLNHRLSQLQTELNEERQLGKALRGNQQHWQTRMQQMEEIHAKLKNEKENEIKDLKEQLRDLMFYIDAQQVIAKSSDCDDIAGGTVTIGQAAETNTRVKNKGRKKR